MWRTEPQLRVSSSTTLLSPCLFVCLRNMGSSRDFAAPASSAESCVECAASGAGTIFDNFAAPRGPGLPGAGGSRLRRTCTGEYTIGALIIRIGFWGILYYSYNKEPPQNPILIIKAPIVYVTRAAVELSCPLREAPTAPGRPNEVPALSLHQVTCCTRIAARKPRRTRSRVMQALMSAGGGGSQRDLAAARARVSKGHWLQVCCPRHVVHPFRRGSATSVMQKLTSLNPKP